MMKSMNGLLDHVERASEISLGEIIISFVYRVDSSAHDVCAYSSE
jgi:hypothetical protein